MTFIYRVIYFLVVRILLPVLHGCNDKVAKGYKLRQPQNGLWPWLNTPHGLRPLWIHCASGEFEYALPVIREIKKKHPDQKILVTYFTPTYVERMKAEPLVDFVVPAPWDEPHIIQEFIQHHNPKALLFARTDVWFEMSRQCSLRQIPVVVFSMTFQKKISLMLRIFLRWRWQFVNQFWMVSPTDAELLQNLLPKAHVEVVGDSRYDQCLHRLSLRKKLPFEILQHSSQLVIAGSTWPEDEAVVIPTIASTRQFRWILVPHENTPAHLIQLEQLLNKHNLPFSRSSQITRWDGSSVLVVDQMGFLAELYDFATMSFVGGSFRKQVHSVMEPLACGCLTFVGPYYINNREAIEFSSTATAVDDSKTTAVQVVKSHQELMDALQLASQRWSQAQKEKLKEKFLGKTGASLKIASRISQIL